MKKFVALPSLFNSLLLFITIFLIAGTQTAVAAPTAQVPFPDQAEAVQQAVNWLVTTHQNSDGGFTGFSTGADQAPSDVTGTADALLAIASSGTYPAEIITYLGTNSDLAAEFAQSDAGFAGKLILGLTAAAQDARDFAGEDFVAILSSQLQDDGSFGNPSPFGHSLAMLGLAAAGEPVPESAVTWLVNRQATDEGIAGSWDDGFGTNGNSDATGMAIMALKAAGLSNEDEPLQRATSFLTANQLESGGWEYAAGFGENANSTAVVIQALAALDIDFDSPDSPLAIDGRPPLQVLFSYQSESGAFQADFGDGPFDDFFTTVQAIPAAAGNAFPILDILDQPIPVDMEEMEEEAVEETEEMEPTPEPEMEETAAVAEETVEEEEATAVPDPTPEPEPTPPPAVAETNDEGDAAAEEDADMTDEPVTETADEHNEPAAESNSFVPMILVILALGLAGAVSYYLRKGTS